MAALEGMLNGVMATAGDYVEFSASDREKLMAAGISAIDDGTDVTILSN